MTGSSFVFSSVGSATEALLAWAGDPQAESASIDSLTIEQLSNGLREYAPAVLEVIGTGEAFAIPRPGRVLTRDGRIAPVKWPQVKNIWESPARDSERLLFEKLPVESRAIEKLIDRRIARSIGQSSVVRLTHFTMPPREPFHRQLHAARWWNRLAGALVAHFIAYVAFLMAWALLGQAALSGRWDDGWFWGSVVLLAIVVPLEGLASWWQGWLSVTFGGLFKQRLLAGSLEIDTDKIRREGVGQLLGRVLESDALESVSLTGGTAALLSTMELLMSLVVLAFGVAPPLLFAVLAGWMAVVVAGTWRFASLRRDWVHCKNELTHDLIEKMNGHRTRIAQQPPSLWHVSEDRLMAEYLKRSAAVDRIHALLAALGPRGWLIAGMSTVGWQFAAGRASPEAIAISTAGVLLGYQALRRFVFGVGQCAAAWQSWDKVRDLFAAAGKGERDRRALRPVAPSEKVLDVRDLAYAYPGRDRQVLAKCSIGIFEGEHILLEGASGSGKSTFGALLAGLRRPTNGLLLAGGMDFASVGAQAWRKLVAIAPQYHENHLLAAPLLFNLLMGRSWPAGEKDWTAAYEVCLDLGLGPLLERMPAGLLEMVGDTGWQLSQGERSRVYLARAILQGAKLVILDESFAALDPETLDQCLECVLRRAPSLLVIAHP